MAFVPIDHLLRLRVHAANALLLGALSAAGLAAQPVLPRSATPVPGARASAAHAAERGDTAVFVSVWPSPLQPILAATPVTGVLQPTLPNGVSPWFAPVLSALVPGAGQGLLRQQRGVAYLVAEGYLILQAVRSQRDATREQNAYREIARTVARAGVAGDRPDGPWPYYERMQYILESGVYNRTPHAGFTPETDVQTFNGATWRLAREMFWVDPDVPPDVSSAEYQRAIAFYKDRAATDAFQWSWRDAQLEQDLFRQTIHRSNEASRRARQMTGLLLANHALSLVDAYISVRLRVFGTVGADGTQQFGVTGQVPLPGR